MGSLSDLSVKAMKSHLLALLISFFLLTTPAASDSDEKSAASVGGRGRSLVEFKETKGNVSFQCSPSGPCIPCLYSEKNDEKYRCSETGYRVPLKCIEIQDSPKGKTKDVKQRRLYSTQDQLLTAAKKFKWRRLLDDSLTSEDGKHYYITYRSCVPVDGEEKLSLIGFEMIMVGLLLVSGPIVYMRQRRSFVMPGVGAARISSTSTRF